MNKKKVGVLISGGGSNLQALIAACVQPDFPAEVAVVISNKDTAYGLNRARQHGIPAHVINHKEYATRQAFDDTLHQLLERHLVEIVCLAGFMRLLTPEFVARWHDRMLNIHPSLLPAFKGVDAIGQALKAGVKITGCTVHLVRSDMDSGPIIMQSAVPVLPEDTHETLAARVLEQEHILYPQALKALAADKIVVNKQKALILD